MKKKINSCKIVTNKFPTNTKKIWDLEVEQKKQFLKKIRSSEVVVGSKLGNAPFEKKDWLQAGVSGAG